MILLLKPADHLSSSRLNKNVKRGPAAGLLLWRRDKQRRRRTREEETTEARANCQDVWARWQGNQSGWGVRFSKSSKITFDIESIIFQAAGCRLRCFCNPRSQGQPGARTTRCRKVNKQLQFLQIKPFNMEMASGDDKGIMNLFWFNGSFNMISWCSHLNNAKNLMA